VPLAFLTAKLIHIQAAAQRLVDYWERRREVFGQDLCYLPFTQDGALHQDMVALSQGVIHILGTDASGRSVTYVDLGSVDWTLVPPESFVSIHTLLLLFLVEINSPRACVSAVMNLASCGMVFL